MQSMRWTFAVAAIISLPPGCAFAEVLSPIETVRAFVSTGIGPASTDARMDKAERAYMTPDLYRLAKRSGGNVVTMTQDTSNAIVGQITLKGNVARVAFRLTGSGGGFAHDYVLVKQDNSWKINNIIYRFAPRGKNFSLRHMPLDDHGTCTQRPGSNIQDCN